MTAVLAARPRAMTFDLDGTLYDAKRARRDYLWRNLGHLRAVRVTRRVREDLRGRDFGSHEALLRAEAEELAQRLGTDAAHARQRADDVLGARLCQTLRRIGPWPDAETSLRRLHDAGITLGVVSDYEPHAKLEALGLHNVPWQALIGAECYGALKPWPSAFHAAAAQLGVAPGHIVHVGDRRDTDGEGARRAGYGGVVLLGSHGGDEPRVPTLAAVAELVLSG
ncbi:MAG: HAD family hydrolase [Myxococcota bacterium]